MNLLKNTNKKLGKAIYSFSLPRSTCLYKSEACDRYCYAKKGAFARPIVQKNLDQMYNASQTDYFVLVIIRQIQKQEIKWIRIHPVGDFYSQEYLEKWINIAYSCPDTKFLTYTKNTKDDFSQLPINLIVYASVDFSWAVETHRSKHTLKGGSNITNPSIPKTATLIKQNIGQYSHMQKIKDKGWSPYFVCDSTCKHCKTCWSGKINVAFPYRNNLPLATQQKIKDAKKNGTLKEYCEVNL